MNKPFIAVRIDGNSGRLLEAQRFETYSEAYTQVWSENYANLQVGYSPEWDVFVEATEELVAVGRECRSSHLYYELVGFELDSI